jgi:hypothetical protein
MLALGLVMPAGADFFQCAKKLPELAGYSLEDTLNIDGILFVIGMVLGHNILLKD